MGDYNVTNVFRDVSALNDGNSNGYNNDDETLLIYMGERSADSAHCVDTRSNGQ